MRQGIILPVALYWYMGDPEKEFQKLSKEHFCYYVYCWSNRHIYLYQVLS